MASILYYSKYCKSCNELLKKMCKNNVKDKIHFVCIDKREIINNKTYIILENNVKILLPSNVIRVPSLLLLSNKKVLSLKEIYDYIKPSQEYIQKITKNNMEPLAYSTSEMTTLSDNYSYLDQTSDELSAKGTGGLRQMHSFASIDFVEKIDCPPDDYVPDKLKDKDYNKFVEDRQNELKN